MDAETRWWVKLFSYIFLSVIGGVLGYIMRSLDSGQKPSLSRSLVEGTAAGFAGVLIILLCRVAGIGEEMTGVIVGIGGWLGASATIRKLEPFVFRKIGGSNGPSNEQDPTLR